MPGLGGLHQRARAPGWAAGSDWGGGWIRWQRLQFGLCVRRYRLHVWRFETGDWGSLSDPGKDSESEDQTHQELYPGSISWPRYMKSGKHAFIAPSSYFPMSRFLPVAFNNNNLKKSYISELQHIYSSILWSHTLNLNWCSTSDRNVGACRVTHGAGKLLGPPACTLCGRASAWKQECSTGVCAMMRSICFLHVCNYPNHPHTTTPPSPSGKPSQPPANLGGERAGVQHHTCCLCLMCPARRGPC